MVGWQDLNVSESDESEIEEELFAPPPASVDEEAPPPPPASVDEQAPVPPPASVDKEAPPPSPASNSEKMHDPTTTTVKAPSHALAGEPIVWAVCKGFASWPALATSADWQRLDPDDSERKWVLFVGEADATRCQEIVPWKEGVARGWASKVPRRGAKRYAHDVHVCSEATAGRLSLFDLRALVSPHTKRTREATEFDDQGWQEDGHEHIGQKAARLYGGKLFYGEIAYWLPAGDTAEVSMARLAWCRPGGDAAVAAAFSRRHTSHPLSTLLPLADARAGRGALSPRPSRWR